jgi:hypothetical protein
VSRICIANFVPNSILLSPLIDPEKHFCINVKVDGSLLGNCPVKLYAQDSAGDIAVFNNQADPLYNAIVNFFPNSWALNDALLGSLENHHLHDHHWRKTLL